MITTKDTKDTKELLLHTGLPNIYAGYYLMLSGNNLTIPPFYVEQNHLDIGSQLSVEIAGHELKLKPARRCARPADSANPAVYVITTKDTKDTKEMQDFESIDSMTEALGKSVLDAAYRVHSELGPGLIESVYETCLAVELEERGVSFARQVVLPIQYAGKKIDSALRIDLLVGGRVIVELKAVESIAPIHKAQVITYLKLTKLRLGLLINFNTVHLRDGIRRIVL